MKLPAGVNRRLIIYYYNLVELTAMATAKIFMVRRVESYTTGSNIKLAWNNHVLHSKQLRSHTPLRYTN